MQETCKRARKGLDTISVTGNVLRSWHVQSAYQAPSGALCIVMRLYRPGTLLAVFSLPTSSMQLNATIFTRRANAPYPVIRTLLLISFSPSWLLCLLRDYLTDLFPILELGTSAKVNKCILSVINDNQLPDAFHCSSSGWRKASWNWCWRFRSKACWTVPKGRPLEVWQTVSFWKTKKNFKNI